MSGDDDRAEAKPKTNPFVDEAGVSPPRARRVKPPPGIISAGGVDMARAHASGIKLRDAVVPEPITDQPRVVIAVETDLRKVPTHKRLLEGREPSGDGARSALLPVHGGHRGGPRPRSIRGTVHAPFPSTPASGSSIVTGGTPSAPETDPAALPAPAPPASDHKLPPWVRVAFPLLLLLVLVGLAERYREPVSGRAPAAEPVAIHDGASAHDPRPKPRPPAEAIAPPLRAAGPSVLVEAPPVAVPPAPSEVPQVVVNASPGATPASNAEAPRRPVKPPAPPARTTFTPPFQLPGEKN